MSSSNELLTPEEVIEILRLRELGVKNPKASLRHLRRMKRIGFVRICGKILYPEKEVQDYIEKHYEPPKR